MSKGTMIEWESEEDAPAIEWETEKVQNSQTTKTQAAKPAPQGRPPAAPGAKKGAAQVQKPGLIGGMFQTLKSDFKMKMNYDSTKMHLPGPFKKQKNNFRFDGDLTIDTYCMLGPSADVDDSLKPVSIVGGNMEVGRKMGDGKKAAAVVNSKLTVGRKLMVHGHMMGNGSVVAGDVDVKGSLHIKDLSAVGNVFANSIKTQVKVEAKVGSISVVRSIHSDDDLFAGHSIEVAKGNLYCHDLCDAMEIRCPKGNIDVGRFGLYNQVLNGKFHASRPKLRYIQAGTKWAPGYIRIENQNCYNAVMNAFHVGELRIVGEVINE